MKRQTRYKGWDGKVRLFSPDTGEIYCGLYDYVTEFASARGAIHSKPRRMNGMGSQKNLTNILLLKANRWVGQEPWNTVQGKRLPIQEQSMPLKHNRKLLLSPTSSGKSLMIYCIVRYHVAANNKVLIVVPTTSLVEQLSKDFEDYGWDSHNNIHKIYAGYEKLTDKPVVITTQQSVYKQPKLSLIVLMLSSVTMSTSIQSFKVTY